jgi:Ser/Thr protein kinase RdoA (MazF antagonist)
MRVLLAGPTGLVTSRRDLAMPCCSRMHRGSTQPQRKRDNCRAYGEVVARQHVGMDRRRMDPRRFHLDLSHLIDKPLQHFEPLLEHRPEDLDYLQRVGGELRAAIEALLPKTPPVYGFCHGDHHGGNIHQDDDGQMGVFDFDCWGYGWRAYDHSHQMRSRRRNSS